MAALLLRRDAGHLSPHSRRVERRADARASLEEAEVRDRARALALDLRGTGLALFFFVLSLVVPLPITVALATWLHIEVLWACLYGLALAATLPLTAAQIGRIWVQTSHAKLALRSETSPSFAHLRGGLARLARETQTALAVTETHGGVPFGRAIWEWTWAIQYLDVAEKQWLEDRGFDLLALLQELDGASGRPLTSAMKRRARGRLLELLEVLAERADSPYRRML